MTGSGPQDKKHSFADLGPAWISAIAALVAALVAVAGFFTGRVTASAPDSAQGGTAASGTPSMPARTPAISGASPGTLLTRYSVDVAAGYGIDIAGQPQRPREGIPGNASMVVPVVNKISSKDGGKLAQLDNVTDPTFDTCFTNTRFTSTAYVDRGDALCYTGRGYVAAVKITDKVIAVTGDYLALDITVWKSP